MLEEDKLGCSAPNSQTSVTEPETPAIELVGPPLIFEVAKDCVMRTLSVHDAKFVPGSETHSFTAGSIRYKGYEEFVKNPSTEEDEIWIIVPQGEAFYGLKQSNFDNFVKMHKINLIED